MKTDLALEIADLCDRLGGDTQKPGAEYLGGVFSAKTDSPEFALIIASIVERTVALEALLVREGVEGAVLAGAIDHLSQIREGFSFRALGRPWNQHGRLQVSASHSSPIRMLSAAICQRHSYAKLSDTEISEITSMVDELLIWLKEHQIKEQDFIRQNLIDGLERFIFRVQRLKWFGWGYSIDTLRDVLLAYMTLERGLNPVDYPDAQAVLNRIGSTLKKVAAFTSNAKDTSETVDWVISLARGVMKVAPSAGGYVAGLLTHG